MWSQLDKLFKEFNLDLHLTPYGVLATSEDEGLMEFVHPSMPLSKNMRCRSNLWPPRTTQYAALARSRGRFPPHWLHC